MIHSLNEYVIIADAKEEANTILQAAVLTTCRDTVKTCSNNTHKTSEETKVIIMKKINPATAHLKIHRISSIRDKDGSRGGRPKTSRDAHHKSGERLHG